MGVFRDRLERRAPLILDGGLATTLETHGHDLDDPLWSARLLLDDPDAIVRVHREFLAAGADVIISAGYQASETGFRVRGLSEVETEAMLRLSVDLAIRARDGFWQDTANRTVRTRPLVAASIGPYGAYLGDGSEYRGDYGLDAAELRTFHESRWRVFADTPADLLACETIPSFTEACVLLDLLGDTPDREAWLSVSCIDDRHLCDGSAIVDLARACDAVPNLVAVGINCTPPRYVASLIGEVRRGTTKPVIVYPNRGERYDAVNKRWVAGSEAVDWDEAVVEWRCLGAAGIGGCCRVGPRDIATIRRRLGYHPSS